MKHTRVTAFAAVGLAAALSLTARSGDSSGKDSSAQGASTPSSDASASSSSPSDGGSDSGGSTANDTKPDSSGQDAQAGTGAGSTKGASKAGARVTFCRTANFVVDAAPDETSGRINITMVNRGSTTCSATGFAGVDIKDADHTSNPVERGPAQPRITILKPGDTAIFDLAYTIDATGNSLSSPTDTLVTPPNETHTVSLDWPAAAGQIKGAYTDVQVYPTHTTK